MKWTLSHDYGGEANHETHPIPYFAIFIVLLWLY